MMIIINITIVAVIDILVGIYICGASATLAVPCTWSFASYSIFTNWEIRYVKLAG